MHFAGLHCFVLSSGAKSGFINTNVQNRNINQCHVKHSNVITPSAALDLSFFTVNTERGTQRIRLVT